MSLVRVQSMSRYSPRIKLFNSCISKTKYTSIHRLEVKTGKKTGNKTEHLSSEETEFYNWLLGDCPSTASDVVPLTSGIDSTDEQADREVSEELGGEIDLRFMGTGSGSSTPSPSKMMDLLALKTPVKNVQPEFQRPGPSSATKRPPPPTPRTPSKKQRSDDLVV